MTPAEIARGLTKVEVSDPMLKPCPAVTHLWCQAPWSCAQPCTGRGGDSHAVRNLEPPK